MPEMPLVDAPKWNNLDGASAGIGSKLERPRKIHFTESMSLTRSLDERIGSGHALFLDYAIHLFRARREDLHFCMAHSGKNRGVIKI
jgi:hypothetical protein